MEGRALPYDKAATSVLVHFPWLAAESSYSRLTTGDYPMPRYFFHVLDSRALIDTEGTELAGLDEAHEMAIRSAGSILKAEGAAFWNGGQWRMSVADECGEICFNLKKDGK